MDFAYSPKVEALRAQLGAFMEERVLPEIGAWQREVEAGAWPPSMLEPLKQAAQNRLAEMGARVTGLSLAPITQPNLYELLGLDRVVTSTIADINAAMPSPVADETRIAFAGN